MGLGESSKVVDESLQASMQLDFFVSSVPVTLNTLHDVNDPLLDNVDSVMEFGEHEQLEEEKIEEKQEEMI